MTRLRNRERLAEFIEYVRGLSGDDLVVEEAAKQENVEQLKADLTNEYRLHERGSRWQLSAEYAQSALRAELKLLRDEIAMRKREQLEADALERKQRAEAERVERDQAKLARKEAHEKLLEEHKRQREVRW